MTGRYKRVKESSRGREGMRGRGRLQDEGVFALNDKAVRTEGETLSLAMRKRRPRIGNARE